MRTEEGLWSRSAPWRWTFVLTCLATALVILCGPWNTPIPISTSLASYNPVSPAVALSQSIPMPLSAPLQSASAATATGQLSFHDSTFDVAITPSPVSFPSGTELHAVGVYQGALPNGQQEQPWWAKCGADKSNQQAMIACHQKYAGQHIEKTITVTVSSSSVPMILALMAYEPVKWKIIGSANANIQKIIIAGYHGQNIEGTLKTTPVEVYSYESSPCQICTRQGDYFYAYEKNTAEYTRAINKLQSLTELSPTSFQGAYQSERFYIASTSQPSHLSNRLSNTKTKTDPITGESFTDRVSITNMTVPLPEGNWQGLVYAKNPSNRGTDELAILARIEHNQLAELIAVRAQFVTDGNGFSRHLSCETPGVHKSKVENNETSGAQLCYWVTHDTDPWVQPIFALAANRLAARGIIAPTLLVNSAFHKANQNTALTVFYFSNPEIKKITTPQINWNASPWHPNQIKQFPDKAGYVKDRLEWANLWFQIFKAM